MKRSSKSLNAVHTTPVTTAEACETSMGACMKSMEANINALTDEMKQLKIREPTRKNMKENQVTDKFVVTDITSKVKA